MKKLISIVLAALIICSVATVAFAAPSVTLTKEQALQIALNDAGLTQDEVTIIKTQLELDDGRYEYEIDFTRKTDRVEFDYTIDAQTGTIYEAEKDYPDTNDFIAFFKWLFELISNLFKTK